MVRFWNKAIVNGDCFEWVAGKSRVGYGKFQLEGRTRLAHRVAYEMVYGDIPGQLTIDHLCMNKLCVNPMHMELVTLSENVRRKIIVPKTHCKHGHEFNKENTYYETRTKRKCRNCNANRMYRGINQRYKYKEAT